MNALPARFWAKVDVRPDACWLWTGALTRWGYGNFGVRAGMNRGAHRLAYESLVGPIPAGLHLDHLCRVRHCVNPEHLEPVCVRVNVLRGVGFAARNAMKTYCINGHPYDEANTCILRNGRRKCRACGRISSARDRAATRYHAGAA